MNTVGVVLAGCGYLDGAEIYESVLTLLHLDRLGIAVQCLAPDIAQMHVVDHYKGEPTTEQRNVLIEAARVARGKIQPLQDHWVEKLDAVIFPGGFGAAKNYCDYATAGEQCSIHPQIESFMVKMVQAKKPVGVICISPLVLSRALVGSGLRPKLTLGADSPAAECAKKFGAEHIVAKVTECVVDEANRFVSTPAFMCQAKISEISIGIERLVREVVRLMQEAPSAVQRQAVVA